MNLPLKIEIHDLFIQEKVHESSWKFIKFVHESPWTVLVSPWWPLINIHKCSCFYSLKVHEIFLAVMLKKVHEWWMSHLLWHESSYVSNEPQKNCSWIKYMNSSWNFHVSSWTIHKSFAGAFSWKVERPRK